MSLIAGVLAGLTAAGVVYFVMGLYVWTVIHSGWSDGAIRAYHASLDVVPLVIGLAVALWVYRIRRSRTSRRRT